MSVTVYSTGPDCKQCWATCKRFEDAGITVTVRDLSESGTDADREYVTTELGYSQAPVVVVDDEPQNHWSGFRPDLIQRLITAHHDGRHPAELPAAATAPASRGMSHGR
ncbi:glutaredoxin family protein [Microbacterium testaceum]|nr:glutaredoxin family protein [Microbacterium testaceum]